jgi:hypothetical protein
MVILSASHLRQGESAGCGSACPALSPNAKCATGFRGAPSTPKIIHAARDYWINLFLRGLAAPRPWHTTIRTAGVLKSFAGTLELRFPPPTSADREVSLAPQLTRDPTLHPLVSQSTPRTAQLAQREIGNPKVIMHPNLFCGESGEIKFQLKSNLPSP